MSLAVSDYIPEPLIMLMGCRSWPAPPRRDGRCGVCGGGIHPGDNTYHCLACDSSSPAIEHRVRSARIGLAARDRAEQAGIRAVEELRRKARAILTESERRQLWNGYRGGIKQSNPEVTNRARYGREFLRSIGQEPDFNLILDARGKVVGRTMPPEGAG